MSRSAAFTVDLAASGRILALIKLGGISILNVFFT